MVPSGVIAASQRQRKRQMNKIYRATASWCGPCMMMSPVVEQIEKEHPEIKVGKVNVDEEMVLAQKFMVVSIPTLILFKNGKPEITSVGFKGKEELEEIFKLK